MYSTSWKFSASWKYSLHIAYVFKKAWNVLIKFWYPDPMFSRNIFTPYTYHLKHLRMRNLQLLLAFKQAIKMSFGRIKFGKRTVGKLQTRIHF